MLSRRRYASFGLASLLCCSCAAGLPGHEGDRADGGGGSAVADAAPVPVPAADARPPGADDAAAPSPDGGAAGGPPATCTESAGSLGSFAVIACVPEGMEGKTGEPAALVLVLHGYTQDASDMLAASEWDVLAGRYGFYVALPQTSLDARAWYWYTSGRSRGQSDPAGLIAVVDAMKAEHDIDPARVYVAGFSAGGYMALSLLADYPEVFAAGAVTSGGAHGCGVLCPSVPSAGGGAAAVRAEHPAVWNDPAAQKPRLLVLHGELDGVNAPGNAGMIVQQWTGALGIDATPDNAALGLADELEGYPYAAYAGADGQLAVATVRLTDLGHGVPVEPGDAIDQGGWDEMPSKTADSCGFCAQDWTNTGNLYGAWYEAQFFGLTE